MESNLEYWNNPGWYEVTLKVKVQAIMSDCDNAEEAQIIAEGLVQNAVEFGIEVPEGTLFTMTFIQKRKPFL